jgi:5-methyltetrahydrofolate--homocysteine methyltransferase
MFRRSPKLNADVFDQISEGVADLKAETEEVCRHALSEGMEPQMILAAISRGLDEVGKRYEAGEYFIPELLAAGEIAQRATSVLRGVKGLTLNSASAKMVLGTVKGDTHDIGKNVVGAMLRGAGIDVVDLGVDISAERFVQAVKDHSPALLGMSSLITTRMTYMETVVKALEESGLRNKVIVVVGGRPVTQEFADRIGADGYAPDAVAAKAMVQRLLGGNKAGRGK